MNNHVHVHVHCTYVYSNVHCTYIHVAIVHVMYVYVLVLNTNTYTYITSLCLISIFSPSIASLLCTHDLLQYMHGYVYITWYGSTLYIGIAMVFCIFPIIRKFNSYFHYTFIHTLYFCTCIHCPLLVGMVMSFSCYKKHTR